ncbi:hypothetical protein ACS0TY_023045 [Phlomoides rotata]
MGDSPNKKKIVVAELASILLVAAMVGIVVSTKSGGAQPISGSNKAVQAICSPTRYKETCEKSLSQANTTDPKKLIQLAFDATAQNIGDVLNKSALLKEAEADPSMKDAYLVCQLELESAVDDLKRSIEHVREFDASKTREYIEDLRTWLSAVVTNQVTCVDAFEGTTGDAGEKMKKMLATARQMSSNALALISVLVQERRE